jgi:hypothetical protein
MAAKRSWLAENYFDASKVGLTILGTIVMFFTSCKDNSVVTNGIYYWKNNSYYSFSTNNENKAIFENEIKKIYFKLADVTWDENYHAEPTNINYLPLTNVIADYSEIIPCIFFTNEVMIRSEKEELNYMAEKISKRINSDSLKELQIDCDWSEASRDNYFYFLKTLKGKLNSGTSLSATIRLYQYRYANKTGIPPVDRGMLMLYNFNSPKQFTGENIIFDLREAKKYLTDTKYQLPLDFAVAHYTWNALYGIDNKFIGFVNKEDSDLLIKNSTPSANNTLFTAETDISINGSFVRKGQKLAVYQSNVNTVKESFELIENIKNTDKYTVAIFDLNENTVKYLLSNESIFKKNIR